MSSIAVIDTNVVVAGLLTSNSESPTARIVDGLLARRFAYALSEALVGEYREILLRRKIRELHGLDAEEVDELLTRFVLDAVVVEPVAVSSVASPDPGDQFLWDLLATMDDPVLVTGEQRLRENPLPNGEAVSPSQFCQTAKI